LFLWIELSTVVVVVVVVINTVSFKDYDENIKNDAMNCHDMHEKMPLHLLL
jgi:hypothetical protein